MTFRTFFFFFGLKPQAVGVLVKKFTPLEFFDPISLLKNRLTALLNDLLQVLDAVVAAQLRTGYFSFTRLASQGDEGAFFAEVVEQLVSAHGLFAAFQRAVYSRATDELVFFHKIVLPCYVADVAGHTA